MVCFADGLDFDSLDVASKLLVSTGVHPMSMYGRSTASGCEESLRKDVGFGNQDVVIPVALHNLNIPKQTDDITNMVVRPPDQEFLRACKRIISNSRNYVFFMEM